ncbi:DUF5906 domain-containing protein [Oceanidesulfovibrio indonesiensis]|nr:DUF5906 domain-containing protein [Oceanidesulfovibrio indonesiensis]
MSQNNEDEKKSQQECSDHYPLDSKTPIKIESINKKFAVIVLPGGEVRILREHHDPMTKNDRVSFVTKTDFATLMQNKVVKVKAGNGENKLLPANVAWLSSPDRREYAGLIFDPSEDIKARTPLATRYYNLFKGFPVTSQEGDWSLFKAHIREVICGGDERVFKYVLAWLADLFQNPGGKRPGVAIVLRGGQGTGKGVFVNGIGNALGEHYTYVSNPEHLTGRFNSHLATSVLVFLDEAYGSHNKRASSVLKAMVTEDMMMLEHKGKDAIPLKNCIRIIMASNDQWVVPAGMDERRFCVLDVSSARQGDYEYFKAICDELENGGREAMVHELIHMDINGFDLRNFPKTDALLDNKLSSLSPVGKFWFQCLQNGVLPESLNGEWGITPSNALHKAYLAFATDMGVRCKADSSRFFKEILAFCPAERKRLPQQKSGTRPWGYLFPPLYECRRIFDNKLGASIQWGDGDEEDMTGWSLEKGPAG